MRILLGIANPIAAAVRPMLLAVADTLFTGKSDPFVEVSTIKDEVLVTKVIKNNLSPVWNEVKYLPVLEKEQSLRLEMFDWDAVNVAEGLTLKVWPLKRVEVAHEDIPNQGFCSVQADVMDTGVLADHHKCSLTKPCLCLSDHLALPLGTFPPCSDNGPEDITRHMIRQHHNDSVSPAGGEDVNVLATDTWHLQEKGSKRGLEE